MSWEVVIGLETHVQLQTKSKIFSPASTAFGAPANTQTHPVDLALPGVLPVLNRAAVEAAIRFGLAVNGQIARRSIFARKNYFYPDLPKGYQISQFEQPIVSGGQVEVMLSDGQSRRIELTRAHLEEDAGKSVHEGLDGIPQGQSGIDLNRAGTPLLEIVTEPVMRSAAEAVAYAKALHSLVRWIGICDGNLQEGSFRIDANVSVRRQGQLAFGTRCEIKNLNSFRFLERAIQVEAQRQVELLEDGGVVIQQTRLFDPDRDETRAMRSKEDAHDYRYFPDPDLPPLVVSEEWMAQVQSQMPTLPAVRRAALEQRFGLSAGDAALVTATREASDFFDLGVAALEAAGGADSTRVKLLANWVMGELASALNREDLEIQQSPLSAQRLTDLVVRVADGTLSNKIAREVFSKLWATPGLTADQVIESEGLRQVQDSGQLQGWVQEVISANPKMVEEYQSGKDKALNALMGQVMKRSGGKANPQAVTELLKAAMQAGRPD